MFHYFKDPYIPLVYRAKVRYRSQRAAILVCFFFVFSLCFFCSDTLQRYEKNQKPLKSEGLFLVPGVIFNADKVKLFERAIFFLFEVIIYLHGVISFAIGGVLCRGYYIRANRTPGLSDGAIYLEKVKAHDLAFHFSFELDICPCFF